MAADGEASSPGDEEIAAGEAATIQPVDKPAVDVQEYSDEDFYNAPTEPSSPVESGTDILFDPRRNCV